MIQLPKNINLEKIDLIKKNEKICEFSTPKYYDRLTLNLPCSNNLDILLLEFLNFISL